MINLESTNKLKELGIKFRLIELGGKGVSFKDVVVLAKDEINPNEICKTIVVEDKKGNKYAFLLKGDKKIDFAKAKEIIGQKASIVSYKSLKKVTGREPGAICPLLLDMPIFVDKMVFETEKINFGSGDCSFGLEINSRDLEKVIRFKKVDVQEE